MAAQIIAPTCAQFGINKAHIKIGIMGNQGRVTDKIQKRLRNIGEKRLVSQKRCAQPMHFFGLGGHIALRIKIDMKCFIGRCAIDQFQTPDFNHAVAAIRVKACRLRIKNNFAHFVSC